MRGIAFFLAGLILGGIMMQASSAQQQKVESGLKLNHVGFNVKNFDESLNFYTKTMGFREAFTLRGPDGKPTLSYIPGVGARDRRSRAGTHSLQLRSSRRQRNCDKASSGGSQNRRRARQPHEYIADIRH